MQMLILVLIYSSWALSEEFNPRTDIIADNYDAGAYLIYDCKEEHWTCVTESFYHECEKKRAKDFSDPQALFHSCAPIGVLPTKRSCYERQSFLTTHHHGTRFCLKDEWKLKNINF